jgi:ubiquinone/menaquinone biosynthesis C-methylase UbiE
MKIYDDFAYVYTRGQYTDFSKHMAERLPVALEQVGAGATDIGKILDLACGDGTFAVGMARKGSSVTGIDSSPRMLEFARKKAGEAGVSVEFILGDIRSLEFDSRFDLVTCWYDSLNYIIDKGDLRHVFEGAARALKNRGLFVFDMNTIYGLVVLSREYPCYVENETSDIFEVHRHEFDYESGIATMKITCFVRENDGWRRVDEEHMERGYSQEEIREILNQAGFQLVAAWGSFRDMSDASSDSGRVWYVARRT